MNPACAECREIVSSSLAGDAAPSAAAEAHLASCESCHAAVQDLVWQDLAIAEMAGRDAKRAILSRLHASLAPRPGRFLKPAIIAASVAAVVLMGILLVRNGEPPSHRPARQPASIVKQPVPEMPKPVEVAPTPPERIVEEPPKPIPRAPDPAIPPPVPAPPERPAPAPPAVEPPSRPPTVPAIARLTGVRGEVRVAGELAREGQDLLEGRSIEVKGAIGRSRIEFQDGTTLDLRRNTLLSSLSAANGKRVVIERGAVTARVAPQPKAAPMIASTPHGEVTVVGTDLRISVASDTRVDVQKGEVRVKRDSRTLTLTSGQTTTIAEGKPFAARKLLPPLEELSSQLAPAGWAELETDGLEAPAILIRPWWPLLKDVEEAKWDPVQRQLHLLAYSTQEETHYWTYDERTNAWERRPTPVGQSWFGPAYDHVAFDPAARALFFRQHNHHLIHQLDLRTSAWSTLPQMPVNPGQIGALEYFPEMGGLVFAGGGTIYLYRFKTKKWDVLAKGIEFGPSDAFLEYDPVHRVMLLGGGTGSRNFYRLDPSGTLTALRDAPVGLGLKDALVVVEPAGGRMLVLSRPDGKTFHEYDVAQNRWTALEPPSLPVMRATRNAHTAAAPILGENIVLFLVADEESAAVYAYRRK